MIRSGLPPFSPEQRRETVILLRLAGPLIAGQVATVAQNFVDTVMAGRLSPQALAAVALGGAVWQTLLLFLIGVLTAISPSVAQLAGAGREDEAGGVVQQAMWIAAGLSALAVAGMMAPRPLLELLDVEPSIIPTALGYLRALAWGVPGVAIYLVLRYLCEGMGETRPVMWIGLVGLGVNVFANWTLMYGRLGFPALGAVGCGYATAIVFWVQGLAMVLYAKRAPLLARIPIRLLPPRPDAAVIRELLRIGVPIGVSIFLESSMFAGVALLMGSLGTIAVAAHQVAINFIALAFMVPLGLAMATTVRVGRAAGQGDPVAVRRSGWTGIGLALAVQAVTAAVLLTMPRWIARIYTEDQAVLGVAVQLLMLAAIFQFSDGLQVSAAGALRGLKDTRVPMWITLAAYWGVGLPAAWMLGIRLGLGPRGLWSGWIFGLTVAAVLLARRFVRLSTVPAADLQSGAVDRTYDGA